MKNEKTDSHIRQLRGQGFILFPLIKERKEPTAAAAGWRKASVSSFTEDQLEEGNYAVAARSTDLFIDIDPRHFTPGDKPLARLVEAVGPLQTYTVKTGNGGMHLYFSKPASVKTAYTLKAYPGIEFRREGMYIVGPGCTHPDTKKTYEVLRDVPVAPAPEKLLELLRIDETPFSELAKEGEGKDIEYQNDAQTQARFVSYLMNAPLNGSYKVACAGRDLGLPPALTLELMAEHWNPRRPDPRNEAELESKVIHAYKYARKAVGNQHPAAEFSKIPKIEKPMEASEEVVWQTNKEGHVIKCFYNTLNFLRCPKSGLYKVFGYNEFTGQVEFINPAPWHKGLLPTQRLLQDVDLKLLKGYLAVRHGYEAQISVLEEAIANVAHSNKFHPVQEYLLGLKWDGVERLDQWLQKYAGVADSQYTRAVGRKVLCAAVARIMKPGCIFHHVMIMEGPQNAGKSQLCKALGGQWFTDAPIDPSDYGRAVDTMQGKWICELAEMSVLNRTEMSALKAFITRASDRVRQAYGRLTREFLRQSIFIGTINPDADGTYLTDGTGNRRFWPVEVGEKIDFKGVAAVRDQLFAEAVQKVKEGEQIFMDNKGLEEEARMIVGKRHADHPWTERVATWLSDPNPGLGSGAGREFITARDIFLDALGGTDQKLDRRVAVAIANVMRTLGWRRTTQRVNGVVLAGYTLKPPAASAGVPAAPARVVPEELEGLM